MFETPLKKGQLITTHDGFVVSILDVTPNKDLKDNSYEVLVKVNNYIGPNKKGILYIGRTFLWGHIAPDVFINSKIINISESDTVELVFFKEQQKDWSI